MYGKLCFWVEYSDALKLNYIIVGNDSTCYFFNMHKDIFKEKYISKDSTKLYICIYCFLLLSKNNVLQYSIFYGMSE